MRSRSTLGTSELRQRMPLEPAEPSCVPARADERALIGFWRYDIVAGELLWSDELRSIFGYTPDVEPSFEAMLACCTAPDRQVLTALVHRAVSEPKSYALETRMQNSAGAWRDVVWSGAVERAPEGSVAAIVGVLQDVTERNAGHLERDRLLERSTFAAQAGNVGIWDLDIATNCIIWNDNMYALYGIDTGEQRLHDAWARGLHPDDSERVEAALAQARRNSSAVEIEFRVLWPNGEERSIRSQATVVRDASGAAVRMIGTNWDVTEVRLLAEQLQAEKEALSRSETRYRLLTDAIPQMVFVVDADERLEYVNDRWTQFTGFTLEQSRAGGREYAFYPKDLAVVRSFRAAVPPREFECEVRLRRRDGIYRWHLFRAVPFADGSGPGKWIVSAIDIEERKNAEARLERTAAELIHLTQHDLMTNLPNRKLLMDRLDQAIQSAAGSGSSFTVVSLDLDRFKGVNDRYGHAAGDTVLAQTATRLADTLRPGDIASRVGGDEFVLVYLRRENGETSVALADRLLAAVSAPIEIDGTAMTVGASIGMSEYPTDEGDAEALVRKADAAMHEAKRGGRNAVRTFTPTMQIALSKTMQFETEFCAAIANKEFVAYYQPMISLHTGHLIGAEALVRWMHPQRGILQPDEFIPYAEEQGYISEIGQLVLHQACAQLNRLNLAANTEFSFAVNVSAQQFAHSDFVGMLAAAIELYDTDVSRLEIEITESILMGNTAATIGILRDLKALGVKLSLDDFGTGYSSLAYIKNFPIDTLKIDRSFVRDIATDRTDQALAKTIITLAHSLGMRVVGEGVETQAQIDALRRFGSDSCQGYLISHPLSATEFELFRTRYSPRSTGRTLPRIRSALCDLG